MSRRGHTEEEMLRALRQVEGGTKIGDICREHSIRLLDGRRFRLLTVVDQFTRECVLLLANSSLTGTQPLCHRLSG